MNLSNLLAQLAEQIGNDIRALAESLKTSEKKAESLKTLGDSQGGSDLKNYLDKAFPVGFIFQSADKNFDPNQKFKGVWQKIENKFLFAADDAITQGTTGGEAEHTLTINEMPAHAHYMGFINTVSYGKTSATNYNKPLAYGAAANATMSSQGGGKAHNNMPPYCVVAMWERVQ